MDLMSRNKEPLELNKKTDELKTGKRYIQRFLQTSIEIANKYIKTFS